MLFCVFCLVLVAAGVVCKLRFAEQERMPASASWDDLLARVQEIDVDGLRAVSECYLHPDEHQLRIEPGQMWKIVGGLAGLEKLRGNASVMLNLAMYAERWNDANGRVLSEIMRRDACRIQAAVRHIEMAMVTHRGLVYLGLELQEAISSYCLMRARLLGLYAGCHAGLLPRLEATL